MLSGSHDPRKKPRSKNNQIQKKPDPKKSRSKKTQIQKKTDPKKTNPKKPDQIESQSAIVSQQSNVLPIIAR